MINQYADSSQYSRIEEASLPSPLRKDVGILAERLFGDIKDYLEKDRVKNPISIYCHIPFCRKRCVFCDLYTLTLNQKSHPLLEKYVDALIREIGLWENVAKDRFVTTIHFGGGTPSCIPPEAMHQILDALKRTFSVTEETEIAIELASRDLTHKYLSFLHEEGIRRIHIGVQSLDDRIRKNMDRVDMSKPLLEKIRFALQDGFILSVDLIFGLPGQGLQGFLDDLNRLMACGVHGFSLYELQVPKSNPKGLTRFRDFVRDRQTGYAMFCEGKKYLENNRYAQNFFVHFSRPPDKNLYCTHPARDEACIALGTISDGRAGPYAFTNAPFSEYTRKLFDGNTPISSGFKRTEIEIIEQKIEVGLLSTVLDDSIVSAMPKDLRQGFLDLSDHWEHAGLLEKASDRDALRVTDKGCWFMGNMLEELRDRLLATQ